MIDPHLTIILPSGEELKASEILQGFMLLAVHEAVFPLLSHEDRLKAAVNLAFEACEQEDSE